LKDKNLESFILLPLVSGSEVPQQSLPIRIQIVAYFLGLYY